ncbi:MAG: hypothetical protein PVJ83_00965 [Gammaproteobacteria bacterium]|jgi:hypothetical protein
MIAIDTLLFGLVGGIMGAKLAMLAAAAVMFVYAVTARARQPRIAPAWATARRQRPDLHA